MKTNQWISLITLLASVWIYTACEKEELAQPLAYEADQELTPKNRSGELSADLPADVNGINTGSYRLLQLYVDAGIGNDSNPGTIERPLATIMEAQARADEWVPAQNPGAAQPGDIIKVRIYASGDFFGQWFVWLHPYRQVVLELRNKPGHRATFYGSRHPCYDQKCLAVGSTNWDPVPSTASNANYGYTFFSAPAEAARFNDPVYSGYGDILIQGLEIKYYLDAILIYARQDRPANAVKIEKNLFYKIGEIAHNPPFGNSFGTIRFRWVNNAYIFGNHFLRNVNYGDTWNEKNLIHAIYLVWSDRNHIKNNTFTEISGQPIKFRDGSDRNFVEGNTFVKAGHAVNKVPFQDWYSEWQVTTGKEKPSFMNVFQGNTYTGGYTSNVRAAFPEARTLVCPVKQGPNYKNAQSDAGTDIRMVVEGKAYWCEERYFPSGRDEGILRDRWVGVMGDPR